MTVLALWSFPAGAQSLFERRIAEANPCAAVRFDKGIIEIRVDRLKEVRIGELHVALKGDVVSAGLTGSLSCKTSDAAAIKGDIGADLAIEAGFSVPDCALQGLAVRLTNIRGTFAPVLDALGSEAEAAIGHAVEKHLTKACASLVESLTE